MEYQVGQIVYAKCGRDEGKPFLIAAVEEEYLYLTDGKCRSLAKPKRKKKKHVQGTGYYSETIAEKLQNGSYLLDAEIVRYLKQCSGRM